MKFITNILIYSVSSCSSNSRDNACILDEKEGSGLGVQKHRNNRKEKHQLVLKMKSFIDLNNDFIHILGEANLHLSCKTANAYNASNHILLKAKNAFIILDSKVLLKF